MSNFATSEISIFCAPDSQAFNQTLADLRDFAVILLEAAAMVDGREVPFVLCLEKDKPLVLFAEPLNQELSDSSMQQLVQGLVEFHRNELLNPATPNK